MGTYGLAIRTTARLVRDLTLGPGQVLAVAFDPSGKRLAAAGDDRKLVVWDLASGNTELSVADSPRRPDPRPGLSPRRPLARHLRRR